MRRRDLIKGIAGSAAAWPLAAHAQQRSAMPVVGLLHPGRPDSYTQPLAAFQKGLNELGFVDGQNLAIDMLRGLDPRISRFAILWDSSNPSMAHRVRETEVAADQSPAEPRGTRCGVR